jgi:hypothetical protein
MPSISGRFGPMGRDGRPDLWGPPINISLYTYPAYIGAPPTSLKKDVVALIDTGAQLCSIDKGFAAEFGLQKGSGVSFLQLGREVPSPSYFATINIPEIGYNYYADLMGSPFDDSEVPYQAILGWELLRRFDIFLFRKSNVVRLDWIGE